MVTVPFGAAMFLCGGLTFTIASSLLLYAMIGHVNQKLLESERIPYLFMYPGKVARVKREYRRLYPESPLPTVRLALNVLSIVCMLMLMVQLGFFR